MLIIEFTPPNFPIFPYTRLILAFFLALNYGKIIVLDDEIKTLYCYVDGRPPLVSTNVVRRNLREYTASRDNGLDLLNENLNLKSGVVERIGAKLMNVVHTIGMITNTKSASLSLSSASMNYDYNSVDVQHKQDYFNSSRRSLSASASDTELCREYMLSYAIFCAYMLSLFLFILLVFSEIYMRRLLEKVLFTEIDLEWEEEGNEKELDEENENLRDLIMNEKAKEMLLELENNSRNNSQHFDETKVIDKNIHHSNVQAVHFNSTQGSSSHSDVQSNHDSATLLLSGNDQTIFLHSRNSSKF